MQCPKIVTWILILSIVNFTLGAPAAVRERLEISVDVDVAKGGRATSQKRYDPLDDLSTSNAADRPPTHILTPSEVEQLWQDVAEQRIDRYSPPTPESPWYTSEASVDSNWPSSNPGLGSHPSPTGGSPPPPLPHPGQSEDRSPGPPIWSENLDTLSSTGHQSTPSQSPARDPVTRPQTPPSPGHLLDEYWNRISEGSGSRTGSQTPPSQSPARDPGTRPQTPPSPLSEFYEAMSKGSSFPWLHPGPSQDRFPSRPGGSGNLDTSSSTGGQTPPSQSPARDPITPPSSSLERWPDEVWDAILKGNDHPLLHPGPSEGRFPNMPPSSVNPDTSSSTGAQPPPPPPPPPQSPARDPVTRPPPSPQPLPDEFWNALLEGSGPPLPHLGPSEGRFLSPPGFSVGPNTLSSSGQPLQPPHGQSPALDPVTRPITRPTAPSPLPSPLPDEFWEALLKGKIKRRTSDPVLGIRHRDRRAFDRF